MSRQQYRQLQRKRPELRLFDWAILNPEFRTVVLSHMKVEAFIAWRVADLLETDQGTASELDRNSDNYPPF